MAFRASGSLRRGALRAMQPARGFKHTSKQKVSFATFNKGDKASWNDPATYPLIAIVTGALAFGSYKLFYVDMINPDTHTSKQYRSTLDYLENDKPVDTTWVNGPMHRGPKNQWRVEGDGHGAKGATIFR
uniref:Uncharacterized protein n=1 Tax=Aplanochytrium stocchinoi TaxID=215587 RepID=A0A7S3PSG2_9STRA|mmetsp:Transcript_20305/g.25933  ORF Transcript_20305/g.25933 Transcript_20305/m.25933 type:complete len:130 (-) Transcript_20305:2256-2645(-)|eukprot:CAMPEP_0204859320 /NCGR_PEP_ID=MMETSP1347-20130617/23626_1 /ASSEMBLY_ACC=CAM_ASM_000690 /TAXON_ID=215587 /ORGANISM="Aplanochytrium stocchinoi, Strain GSBS06" /LENGTH=129 /DNA_ID=CAMNT_0052007769 /DNA_START=135 /DNA_END=524 /DNA_ORIENTATION=+